MKSEKMLRDNFTVHCTDMNYVRVDKGISFYRDTQAGTDFLDFSRDCLSEGDCFDDKSILCTADTEANEGIDFTKYFPEEMALARGEICFAANLYSAYRKKVLLGYANQGCYKIYLNGILLTALPYTKNNEDATIAFLEAGDNLLFIVLDISRSILNKNLKINIYDYQYVAKGATDYLKYLLNMKETVRAKLVFDAQARDIYEWMAVRNDLTDTLTHSISFRLMRVEDSYVLAEQKIAFYEKFSFRSFFEHLSEDQSNFYYFDIMVDGRVDVRKLFIFSSMQQELEYVKTLFGKVKPDFKFQIEGKISEISRYVQTLGTHTNYPAVCLYELLSVYKILSEGEITPSYYQSPSLHHFISSLDGNRETVGVYIPGGYDQDRKYQLVLLLTTGVEHHILFSSRVGLEAYQNRDIIFATVTCKGVTMGSYIGDASFLDCYQELIRTFSIDVSSVCVHGTSNGAYATWAIASAYPHLFSAISPISGNVNRKAVQNLLNQYLINIHENSNEGLDIKTSYEYPNWIFEQNNGAYEKYLYPYERHTDLYKYILHPFIIDKLIDRHAEKYPNHVYYWTDSFAHRRAYYIEIISVVPDSYEAVFESWITENGEWIIKTENVHILKLELPLYLQNRDISVFVNEKQIFAGCTQRKELYADCIALSLTEDCGNASAAWNAGVLACYFGSLGIIIPEKERYPESEIYKTACRLASPKTNGFIPDINVCYPIYADTEITEELLAAHNWIVIKGVFENKLVEQLIACSDITAERTHFQYYNTEYSGEYSVLYALPNRFNRERNITVVFFSSPAACLKNIFLRRLILSSAANGFHAYLNQAVLACLKGRYYVAKNFGDSLMDVDAFIQLSKKWDAKDCVCWDMARFDDALALLDVNVAASKTQDGYYIGESQTRDPNIYLNNHIIDADAAKFAVITYCNQSEGENAQLYYSEQSIYDLSEEKSVIFPVVPNDTIARQYILDFSGEVLWSGGIRVLRFDPFSYDAPGGKFALKSVLFTAQAPIYDTQQMFCCRQGINGWTYMKYNGGSTFLPMIYNEQSQRYEDARYPDLFISETMQSSMVSLHSDRAWQCPSDGTYRMTIRYCLQTEGKQNKIIILRLLEQIMALDLSQQSEGECSIYLSDMKWGETVHIVFINETPENTETILLHIQIEKQAG